MISFPCSDDALICSVDFSLSAVPNNHNQQVNLQLPAIAQIGSSPFKGMHICYLGFRCSSFPRKKEIVATKIRKKRNNQGSGISSSKSENTRLGFRKCGLNQRTCLRISLVRVDFCLFRVFSICFFMHTSL